MSEYDSMVVAKLEVASSLIILRIPVALKYVKGVSDD